MAQETDDTQGSRKSVFYGWYIVGTLFFATFVGVGSRQGFGVFVEAWEKDFGASVGAISVAAGNQGARQLVTVIQGSVSVFKNATTSAIC